MNRIYIEPPALSAFDDINNARLKAEWRADQVSKLYEAIAKREFGQMDGTIDFTKLGEILLALVKLQEMK